VAQLSIELEARRKQARELELGVANCEQQLQASEAARTRGDTRNLELARATAASAARMQVKPSY
jgi:hypothetical protein